MNLCECGCGLTTPIALKTSTLWGLIKGQPRRFIQHHQKRMGVYQRIKERFWSKVNKQGPMPSSDAVSIHPEIAGKRCWVWTAAKDFGYGKVGIRRKLFLAHRVAWFLKHGTWPALHLLHKCDNPPCVRLEHLFEGSNKDNAQDRIAKGGGLLGEANGYAKLTVKKVQRIKEMVSQGKTQKYIALQFGIDQSTVSNIMTQKTWRTL